MTSYTRRLFQGPLGSTMFRHESTLCSQESIFPENLEIPVTRNNQRRALENRGWLENTLHAQTGAEKRKGGTGVGTIRRYYTRFSAVSHAAYLRADLCSPVPRILR